MLEFMTRLNLIISLFRLEANLRRIAGNRSPPIWIDRKAMTRKKHLLTIYKLSYLYR